MSNVPNPKMYNSKKYVENFSEIDWSNKKENKNKNKNDEWDFDPFHETWSRIENGVRVWYDEKPD